MELFLISCDIHDDFGDPNFETYNFDARFDVWTPRKQSVCCYTEYEKAWSKYVALTREFADDRRYENLTFHKLTSENLFSN